MKLLTGSRASIGLIHGSGDFREITWGWVETRDNHPLSTTNMVPGTVSMVEIRENDLNHVEMRLMSWEEFLAFLWDKLGNGWVIWFAEPFTGGLLTSLMTGKPFQPNRIRFNPADQHPD